jgi:hypothetical protein
VKVDSTLEAVKKRIDVDMRPEKPLAPSWLRAILLVPAFLFMLALVLTVFGLRSDYASLGAWGSWGLSLLELAIAFVLIRLALQMVIPGSTPSITIVFSAGLIAIIFHLLVAGISFELSPVYLPEGREWALTLICFFTIFLLGILPLSVASLLAARGLTWLPALVGGVCGLGAGLAAEATWRMHCSVTSWDHVLSSHTPAVFGIMGLGVLAGMLWQLRQLKSRD